MGLYMELTVHLCGPVNAATGFVMNVSDIDACVQQEAIPIFSKRFRQLFDRKQHLGLEDLSALLREVLVQLSDCLADINLVQMDLALTPNRRIAIVREEENMVYFSEKFEFSAMHTLCNARFDEQQNQDVFGKCANPAGHGHNYIIEVKAKLPEQGKSFETAAFEEIVNREFIEQVDHKNLNVDVLAFAKLNPTVENIAKVAWTCLNGKMNDATLECVTIWENDRTWCTYTEPS